MKTPRRLRFVLYSSSMLLASCGVSAPVHDAGPPTWHVVLQGLTPALLSLWGTSPNDVFAVGGPRGNGTPSAVLHYDGHAWKDLGAGGTQTFWWTHGTSDKDVWFVGDAGRIAHWDGAVFRDFTFNTTATLYGVWAGATNDVWAVGGTPGGGMNQPNDVVLHYDGKNWAASPPPQIFGRAFFKVWGTGSDDLYVVGEAATIWHRSGATWTLQSNPATSNLTTVAGCSRVEVYAVGGRDVLRSDGKTWTRVDLALTNDVSGVACASPGSVVIVGSGGLKQRLAGGQWHDDMGAEPYNTELHGAWADPTGSYWAAGGDYITSPQSGAARAGVIGFYGSAVPSGAFQP
ncbi:MAG: hypothetical protein M3O46_21490 [Myxococcota bacterium]|nr:hypothetical protein [Myxococcota bacterium]